jgi:hypothetical protein
LAVAALALPFGLSSANAAATNLVTDWELGDAPLTTEMLDSGPKGINGAIQSDASPMLLTGVDFGGGATGYRWANTQPNQLPVKPQRIIKISDSRLNPGTNDWAISFRYRTTRPFGNIMQKGQAATIGGQIKFELPGGKITCLFKDSSGRRRAMTTLNTYNNNLWHVVRCERTAAGVTLTVDGGAANGGETRKILGFTGNISNTVPMSVGGKINCDQITVTCDYYVGDIDWIKVESSSP